jgi:hypothetical protein
MTRSPSTYEFEGTKANFASFFKQTTVVLIVFIILLLLTRGNPSGLLVGITFCIAVVLVVGLEREALLAKTSV